MMLFLRVGRVKWRLGGISPLSSPPLMAFVRLTLEITSLRALQSLRFMELRGRNGDSDQT